MITLRMSAYIYVRITYELINDRLMAAHDLLQEWKLASQDFE